MSRLLLWSAAACALLFSTTPAALAQAVLATTRAADRVTVTGRVADARTGEGLPGATVRADGTPLGTETDADGRFSITVPGRVTTIAVSAVGGPIATGAVRAQHVHPPTGIPTGAAEALAVSVSETFAVDGLRVDAAAPPPGSGVARASVRWSDGGYATVVYGRPYARGRTVFGGLVGWDAVWAAGAHRATELWTSVPLAVGDTVLAPGGYSLFATPRPDRWTLHVNRALGAHLADEYDAAQDAARVEVVPTATAAPTEALTYSFAGDGRALVLRWARTEVVLPFHRADL